MWQTSVIEAKRLAAVRRYDILDKPTDGSFDRITSLAADLFAVPISIISMVDHDRIWFKSHHGLDVDQVDREPGLCSSAIVQDAPWLLSDAARDPRALTNSLVAGEFGLRFYLGIPLQTLDGFNLGTLCVIDREPRKVTEQQIAQLGRLAAIVMDEMELRLAARVAVNDLHSAIAVKNDALRTAEFMAKELEHRVRNSLQIVGAHLQIQAINSESEELRSELMRASGRVSAVARVHERVSKDVHSNEFDAIEYLRRLCNDLSSIVGKKVKGPTENVVDAIPIASDLIVSIGLIVNELVTNSAKQGASNIVVTLDRQQDGNLTLVVTDDAGGLPKDFDAKASSGLGMQVVSRAVSSLKGVLEYGQTKELDGACFTVTFKGLPAAGHS